MKANVCRQHLLSVLARMTCFSAPNVFDTWLLRRAHQGTWAPLLSGEIGPNEPAFSFVDGSAIDRPHSMAIAGRNRSAVNVYE
jgi:hypothetical protein